MIKSFAVPLLAAVALARNDADGSDQENAYVTELISPTTLLLSGDEDLPAGVILRFYNYNDQTDDGPYELHGDTNMVVVEPSLSSMTYGWCISNTAAGVADANQVV